MKQKQNIREVEKKVEILTRELDVFQNELMVMVQCIYTCIVLKISNNHLRSKIAMEMIYRDAMIVVIYVHMYNISCDKIT